MNASTGLHLLKTILTIAILALVGAGCGKKGPVPDATFKSSGSPPPVSAEPNSFNEVAAYLDPGGSFYLYVSTERWLSGLSTRIADWREILASLPNMKSTDRSNIRKLADVISVLVRNSGIEQVTGVGASGILLEEGTYQNKMMIHHHPGKNQGLLWTAFGQAPHPLTGLECLPESTALASFFDLDVPALWNAIREAARQAAIPEVNKVLEQLPAEFEKKTGLKLDQVLASLGGEVGVVVTLDEERSVKFPSPGGATMDFPEPAVALLVKVKDDTLFNRLDQLMAQNPKVSKVDKNGLKMRTMPLPMPFPVRPTLARNGEYLFLASNDRLVEEILAVRSGKAKGLKATDEFRRLSQGIVLQGNRFDFASPRLSQAIQHVVNMAIFMQSQSGRSDGGAELLQRLLGDGRESFHFSVASNLKEGWFIAGSSSRHPAMTFLAPTFVAPAAMLAGLALPAAAKARDRAQNVACMNNLKQIGLAARMHANDHGGVFPEDFLAMKNELPSPGVLICPGDKSKAKPADWSTVDVSNVSYEIVSPGTRGNEPQEVYARCRIHGTVCRVDGSVQQGRATRIPSQKTN